MSTELLLQEFARTTEAPEAVVKMRRFVFELAIRGRLVSQDPTDEPAEVLLRRCKAALQQNLARRTRQVSPIENPPFSLPKGWSWTRLAVTGRIFNGNSVSEAEKARLSKVGEGLPFIATKDVRYGTASLNYDNGLRVPYDEPGFKIASAGAVLICSEGGSAGKKTGLTDRAICFGNKLYANEPWPGMDSHYLLALYQAPSFYAALRERMTGIIGGIALSEFQMLRVPIPPESEQRRIAAKIGELMDLCDRLEAAQMEWEARQTALRAAALHRLTASDGDAKPGPADVRFFLESSPRLVTKPEHVAALREAILGLAVRGRLVAQDPTDESAAELLAKVQGQKRANGVAVTGRVWVNSSNAPADEGFALPTGWEWSQIGTTVERVTVGYVGPMTSHYVESGIPFLRSQNVRPNIFRSEGLIHISPEFHNRIRKSALQPSDVVVVRSGNVGTACVVPKHLTVANCADLVVIKRPMALVSEFLSFYLNSLASAHVKAGTVGMALVHFNTKSVATMPVPVPPVAEQRRIVARVEHLMALCDELEGSLALARETRARLLDALLQEALDGVTLSRLTG